MRGLPWRGAEGEFDDVRHGLGRQRLLTRRAGLVVQEPIDALPHEALLPAPDHRLGQARPAHNLHGPPALRGGEHDASAGSVLLGRVAVGHNRLKPTAILRRDGDLNPCSHAAQRKALRRIKESYECVDPLGITIGGSEIRPSYGSTIAQRIN